jgi:hypothetical protein
MRHVIRNARWLVAVVWILSWFELYLEIYRYHHVAPSLLLKPASWYTGSMHSRPGGWLRAVLTCSALAPPLYVFLLLGGRFQRRYGNDSRRARPDMPFPVARAAMAFGFMLCALGTINQLVRNPPMDVDLTMRKGNGGFIVIGLAVASVGAWLARRAPGRGAGPIARL